MVAQMLTEEQKQEIVKALRETQDERGEVNISQAARLLKQNRTTTQSQIRSLGGVEELLKPKLVEFSGFVTEGDNEEPAEELVARLRKASERKKVAQQARNWFKIKVNETKPYAILWFGDPHLGDGWGWKKLDRDIAIANQPGVYAGNIGDTTDNWPWTGRLARLWAETEMTDKSQKKVATWFMKEAGINWLIWLGGNHDEWNGGTDFYKMLGAYEIPVIDWRAKFNIEHLNGSLTRIDAAHGRKGNSIYNSTHGTLRDAKFGEAADLYVTGHIHCYGLFDIEFAEKRTRTWLAQISGYKINDRFAMVNGYSESQHGSSLFSIIDPITGRVHCFGDSDVGADYLKYLRR